MVARVKMYILMYIEDAKALWLEFLGREHLTAHSVIFDSDKHLHMINLTQSLWTPTLQVECHTQSS